MSSLEWPEAGLVCLECDNLNPVERDYCDRCGVKLRRVVEVSPPDRAIAYSLRSDQVAKLRERVESLPQDRQWFVGTVDWPAEQDGPVRLTLPDGAARLADLDCPRVADPWQALTRLSESIDALHRVGLRLNGLSFATVVVAEDGQVLGPCVPPCLTALDDPAAKVPLLGVITGFAAPEVQQYTLHDPGRRSDVFSLAALYAYLVTGAPPSDLSAHEFDPSQILESLGPSTREVLTRALALDPSRRSGSASDLVADLLAAAQSDRMRSDFLLTALGVSDIGLGGRDVNEDAFAAIVSARGDRFGSRGHGVAVVADGMGGTQAGERASQFAVEEVMQAFLHPPDWLFTAPEPVVLERVRTWLLERNERLFALGERLGVGREFGTTLSAVAIFGSRVLLMHLGDSRVYRFRAERLKQLTQDQSLAQQYLDEGRLTPEQASTSEYRTVLVSHLGSDHCRPQVAWLDALPCDVFLLATDGLLEGLEDDDLIEVLQSFPPERMSGELLCRAKARLRGHSPSECQAESRNSGSDNMTAVVVCLTTPAGLPEKKEPLTESATESAHQTGVDECDEPRPKGVPHEPTESADDSRGQPTAGGV